MAKDSILGPPGQHHLRLVSLSYKVCWTFFETLTNMWSYLFHSQMTLVWELKEVGVTLLTSTFINLIRDKSRWTRGSFSLLFGILAESWLSSTKSLQRNKKGFNLCMHSWHARLSQGTQHADWSHFNEFSMALYLGPEITWHIFCFLV